MAAGDWATPYYLAGVVYAVAFLAFWGYFLRVEAASAALTTKPSRAYWIAGCTSLACGIELSRFCGATHHGPTADSHRETDGRPHCRFTVTHFRCV
jgi:hypothetical protein